MTNANNSRGSSRSGDPVVRYARKVVRGTIPAGKWQRLACVRFLADLDTAKSGRGPWKYRPELARRGFLLFRLFRHYKGQEWAGTPIVLEPWQMFIVGNLLAWVHRTTGLRRFRNAFVELPRGSGKSTLAGGLLVLLTFFDGEAGAEGYSVATKKDQARITFQAARQMVLRSNALKEHITVSKYNLHQTSTESKLEALGADADTLDGLRPSVAVADEVHKHPSADLIEVIESGMGTREQPLLFEITTAGQDDASVYAQHHLLSTRVLENLVPLPEWFCFIAAADPEDDWTEETTWRKANPNWNVSVKPDFLRKECRKAIANPAEQAKFRRLYLGQKIEAVEAYFSLSDWNACPPFPDLVDLVGKPCWIGLDLSSSIDVTAAVVLWKLSETDIAIEPHFWLPKDNILDRGHRDRVPYDVFAAQGHLELTEGNVIDRIVVRKAVAALAKKWKATAICNDPWQAQEMVQTLQDEDHLKVIPIPQTYALISQPMKDFQARILQRRVRHNRNPLMTLMITNVVPRGDEKGNVLPSKKRSRGRIDGPQATLNALTQLAAPKPARYSMVFLG